MAQVWSENGERKSSSQVHTFSLFMLYSYICLAADLMENKTVFLIRLHKLWIFPTVFPSPIILYIPPIILRNHIPDALHCLILMMLFYL